MQLRFQVTPINLNAQVDRTIIGCINLTLIGHAPGLAFLLSGVSISLGLGPDLHKFLPRLASLAPSFMTKFIDDVLATIST